MPIPRLIGRRSCSEMTSICHVNQLRGLVVDWIRRNLAETKSAYFRSCLCAQACRLRVLDLCTTERPALWQCGRVGPSERTQLRHPFTSTPFLVGTRTAPPKSSPLSRSTGARQRHVSPCVHWMGRWKGNIYGNIVRPFWADSYSRPTRSAQPDHSSG